MYGTTANVKVKLSLCMKANGDEWLASHPSNMAVVKIYHVMLL
jgi:hypothetical protein